mgnify:CR=1 FL=1
MFLILNLELYKDVGEFNSNISTKQGFFWIAGSNTINWPFGWGRNNQV